MGLTAERLAKRFNITREQADEFSVESHKKAIAAIEAGKFDDEIVPVPVSFTTPERQQAEAHRDRLQDGRRPARRHFAGSAGWR